MKYVYCVLFAVLLSGCTALQWANNNPETADIAIRVATTQYISATNDPEKVQARALRVHEKVSGWVAVIDENPTISLDNLEQQVREDIDWVTLDPADQVLADVLIQNVRLQLEKRIENGQLAADYSIKLKTLLSVIVQTTKLYGI